MMQSAIGHKIKDLEQLGAILENEKVGGKRVVHWHGTFDLLDAGHIQQLQAAKALGDLLVVTVVPDRSIHADHQRSDYSEAMRAETVAALQMVDYVGIGHGSSAAPMIRLLKPDVYVRDSDRTDGIYDGEADVAIEAEAVQSVGGTLQFASDLASRNSSMGKMLLTLLPDEVGAWLESFRRNHSLDDILGALASLEPLRVLVIGEVILDEYVYTEALGKSSKEPILAVRYLYQDVHAGGSIAIANHLADFCSSADLVASLGAANAREEFIRSSIKPNVRTSFITKADSPTIVKRRFVEKYQVTKMLEVYEINDEMLSEMEEEQLCAELERLLPECDVAIVADFGHGLIPPRAAKLLCKKAPFLAVNTQINAANIGFHTITKYERADYVCIHEGEMRLDARSRKADLRDLIVKLSERMGCETITVTRGKTGTLIYNREHGFAATPALAIKVVDRLGAGDTVLAITALCAAKRLPPDVIGFIGNLVGAQAVPIVGNSRSIDKAELVRNIQSLLR